MIVAIAGNAVENVTGIVLAAKGRSELAISVVKTRSLRSPRSLSRARARVTADLHHAHVRAVACLCRGVFGTALIVWQITGDGEASLFEGTALVAAYVILAMVAAFE